MGHPTPVGQLREGLAAAIRDINRAYESVEELANDHRLGHPPRCFVHCDVRRHIDRYRDAWREARRALAVEAGQWGQALTSFDKLLDLTDPSLVFPRDSQGHCTVLDLCRLCEDAGNAQTDAEPEFDRAELWLEGLAGGYLAGQHNGGDPDPFHVPETFGPIVLSGEKVEVGRTAWSLLLALRKAWPDGLSIGDLRKITPDPLPELKRLRRKPDFADRIIFPGGRGKGGYRID